MLLPRVLTFNTTALPQYAALARRCGLSAPTDKVALRSLIAAIHQLRASLGMPETISGVEDPERIAEAALADICCRTNPVPVTKEAILAILKAVTS